MYLFKNKVAISLLTLLVFIGQVTASAIPCHMDMQNQPIPTEKLSIQSQMMDHSDMAHMSHNMTDSQNTAVKIDLMNMDCCNEFADCSMGGCFSMLVSFNVLAMNQLVISQETFQTTSFAITQIPNSLYRPPISN